MNPERLLADFLNENPSYRGGAVSMYNEFGTPLCPSGMYAFWEWQAKTGRMNHNAAKSLCEAFVRRFGERVKCGDVSSWKPRQFDDQMTSTTEGTK